MTTESVSHYRLRHWAEKREAFHHDFQYVPEHPEHDACHHQKVKAYRKSVDVRLKSNRSPDDFVKNNTELINRADHQLRGHNKRQQESAQPEGAQ